MNLDNSQIAVRDERPGSYFERFRALRGFKAPRLHRVMLDGDRPRPNVFRGLTVGILLVSALLATEEQATPVGCRDMAAGRTPTACVFRADHFHINADSRRLVCDFETHIGERPAMHLGTQVFSLGQRTVSDVRQVFHHDASCSDFDRVANQCLACDVQEVSRYGCFIARHALQQASGGTSSNGLDGGAVAPDTRTTVIQHPAVAVAHTLFGKV